MVLILPAKPEDADALGAVHVAVWREAYAPFVPRRLIDGLSQGRQAAQWRRVIEGRSAWVLVARDGGCNGPVIGFVSGAVAEDADAGPAVGEIVTLYVLRTRHGRGVGRALFNAAVRRFEVEGYRRLLLWVLATNRPAQRFYKRLGGVKDRVEDDASGDPRLRGVRYRWDRLPRV